MVESDGELVKFCGSNTSPNPDLSALHRWDDVLELEYCNWFTPNMFSVLVSK